MWICVCSFGRKKIHIRIHKILDGTGYYERYKCQIMTHSRSQTNTIYLSGIPYIEFTMAIPIIRSDGTRLCNVYIIIKYVCFFYYRCTAVYRLFFRKHAWVYELNWIYKKCINAIEITLIKQRPSIYTVISLLSPPFWKQKIINPLSPSPQEILI